MSNRRDDGERTSLSMYVEFDNPYENKKEEVFVWIPSTVFCDAFRKWADNKLVTVDGTDSALFWLISDMKAFNTLENINEVIIIF